MTNTIRSTNLRFNLEKDLQRKAWEYLQAMDKQEFKSYCHVITLALVDYFDRYYRTQEDPYLETREREERFVAQIIEAVEKSLNQTLPLFLSGLTTGMAQSRASLPSHEEPEPETDVDWDFLGEQPRRKGDSCLWQFTIWKPSLVYVNLYQIMHLFSVKIAHPKDVW